MRHAATDFRLQDRRLSALLSMRLLSDSCRVAFDGDSSRLSAILSRLPRASAKGAGRQMPRDIVSRQMGGTNSSETNGTGGTSDSNRGESRPVQFFSDNDQGEAQPPAKNL
jgi:hypothetical protein